MEVDILVVFTSLLGLFALMGVGALAVKIKIIKPDMTKGLSAILLKITLPCTVFCSLAAKEYDPAFLRDSLTCVALCFVILAVEAAIAFFLAKYVLHVRKDAIGVWTFAVTYCNNGFIGYPIVQALLGADALALAVMYGIGFNVMVYSLGVWLVCRDTKGQDGKKQKTGLRTVLFNNINIGLAIGAVFYFTRIPVPEIILTPVTHLANMTTALSMFTTGAIMASSSIGNLLNDVDVYKAAAMRLVVFPVIILFILKAVPFENPLIYYMVAVTMMMPSPAVTTILTEMYHGNRDMASKIVLFTSLACMITIPLLTMLL